MTSRHVRFLSSVVSPLGGRTDDPHTQRKLLRYRVIQNKNPQRKGIEVWRAETKKGDVIEFPELTKRELQQIVKSLLDNNPVSHVDVLSGFKNILDVRISNKGDTLFIDPFFLAPDMNDPNQTIEDWMYGRASEYLEEAVGYDKATKSLGLKFKFHGKMYYLPKDVNTYESKTGLKVLRLILASKQRTPSPDTPSPLEKHSPPKKKTPSPLAKKLPSKHSKDDRSPPRDVRVVKVGKDEYSSRLVGVTGKKRRMTYLNGKVLARAKIPKDVVKMLV